MVVGALAASRLPDIDAKLKPGKDHRSLPHSLLLAGLPVFVFTLVLFGSLAASGEAALESLGLSGSLPADVPGRFFLGFGLGYLSHLALDAATFSGIWLAVPGGAKLRVPKKVAVRTGGLREVGAALVMVLLCAVLLEPAVGISAWNIVRSLAAALVGPWGLLT